MPTELELIALQTEFELYLSFTKRLVLNLPDSDDRTRAAIWLQKLRSITSDEQKKLRNEHLKLLLFALHRRSMLGVFAKRPPEELESFHDGLTLLEMTRELIEMTEKQLASGDNSTECPLPPVSTNVSADLKEYSASQTIPKFGAHVYYAISSEPIQMWAKSANCVYPAQSDVPNPLQWELTLSKLTDHVLEKQAEADRLLAEAEKGDKSEAKDDDTHLLPKIESLGPSEAQFKWKPDSLLTLHNNYDFSDIGVAEDLDEQGKHQLELDEMAFDILDHSLPGRQRVVVRDPYYTGLPTDLVERRHHGVVDDVEEESSSSDDMESDARKTGQNLASYSTQGNQFGEKESQDYTTSVSKENYGQIAQKYLSPKNDFPYGIHYDKGGYLIGHCPASFDGDDIVLDFNGEVMKYKGSEGLWRLLTQDASYFDEGYYFTNEDWVVYMEILLRSNEPDSKEMSIEEFSTFSNENLEAACYNLGYKLGGYLARVVANGINGAASQRTERMIGVDEAGGITSEEMEAGDKIGANIYGKLGQLGNDLNETLEKLVPSNLGQNSGIDDYVKFWEWFKCPACAHLKEMDELLRLLVSLQCSDLPKNMLCGFTQNSLLFWLLERIVATLGKDGGLERLIDWSKVNIALIHECNLLNQFIYNLPWGYHYTANPIHSPTTNSGKFADEECADQIKRYGYFAEADESLEAEVKLGIEVLQNLFTNNSAFFEQLDYFVMVSGKELNLALERGLCFLQRYYR